MEQYLTEFESIVQTREYHSQLMCEGAVYNTLSEAVEHHLKINDSNNTEKLRVLTAALNAYVRIRTADLTQSSTKADALAQLLFIKCARCILSIEFHQLSDQDAFKSAFRAALDCIPSRLNGLAVSQRFIALSTLTYHQWSHPTLMAMMKGESVEEQTALSFIRNVEFPDLLRLRVEMLTENDCNQLALNLVCWCVRCELYNTDVVMRSHLLLLLHRLGDICEFDNQCHQIDCCSAVRIIEHAQSSWPSQDSAAVCHLIEMLSVLEWNAPSYCCTQQLLRLWIEFERRNNAAGDLPALVERMSAMCQSSRQRVILLSVVTDLLQDTLLVPGSQLAIKSLMTDVDAERGYVSTADNITVCDCVRRLYADWPQIHLACLASAFHLEPTSSRQQALMSYCQQLDSIPASTPCAPANVDSSVYCNLLESIEQLRPRGFLRPLPANMSELELAVAERAPAEHRDKNSVDGDRREGINLLEINSALHSTLDDIQQILSAGPSSSQDHTHLDEQVLGEITAFLQSGPPGMWAEDDISRIVSVGNISSVTSATVARPTVPDVSPAHPPTSLVNTNNSERIMRADKQLLADASNSLHSSEDAVICLKRYQCTTCFAIFDVAPSTKQHNSANGLCAGNTAELLTYQCRRCSASYHSRSAAYHHALFLCTRDDCGDEIGRALRQYLCPSCSLTFFSLAGLQSHTTAVHGSPQSSVSANCVSTVPQLLSLSNSNFSQAEMCSMQSAVVLAPAPIHCPVVVSNVMGSSPASAEDASVQCKVSMPCEMTPVSGENIQTKPRMRRRYSGRPPKGIIYKNVFMTSEGLYYCSTCNADLNTVERRAEHRDQPCGRASAASYARHYVFICPHCSSRWSSQKACYEHQVTTCLPQRGVNVADLSLRRYSCPVCGRQHFSLAPLRGHMTTAHHLHRDEVVQRLISAGYMTADGTNVKLDNCISMQDAPTVKSARRNMSLSTNMTESEVIALLNKELSVALFESTHNRSGSALESVTEKKPVSDTTGSEDKLESMSSNLRVIASFPQLPKPVLNLRAIPKIPAAPLSGGLTPTPIVLPCSSDSSDDTATDSEKFDANNGTDSSGKEIELSPLKTDGSSETCLSSPDPAACVNECKNCVKNTTWPYAASKSVENGVVTASDSDSTVPSCSVSNEFCATPSIKTQSEKQPYGCQNDEIPLKNGKLKFILNKSEVVSNTGQHLQLPVVALERTTLTKVSSTVSVSASSHCLNLRSHQKEKVHYATKVAVSSCHSFSQQKTVNSKKLPKVSDSWKNGPVLRIPMKRFNARRSRRFSFKGNIAGENRLFDQKLLKKSSRSTNFKLDQFRGRHDQSRCSHRRYAGVSSTSTTAVISTRSHCRQMLKHSVH